MEGSACDRKDVALSIDVTHPFHGLLEQQALVEAVLSGSSLDENHWLEVKGFIDLKKPAGAFAIARHILGFANRHPDQATRSAGGYGYLLIGIDRHRVVGAQNVDPMELVDALRRYLGDSGPAWHQQRLQVRGGEVLLVEVEPPAWGDPIHLLHKDFESFRSGTVLVRNSGGTAPATVGDMEKLQVRLLSKVAVGAGLSAEMAAAFEEAYGEAGGYRAVGVAHRAAHSWGPGYVQNLYGGRFGESAILAGRDDEPVVLRGEEWTAFDGLFGGEGRTIHRTGYPVAVERYADGSVSIALKLGQRMTTLRRSATNRSWLWENAG